MTVNKNNEFQRHFRPHINSLEHRSKKLYDCLLNRAKATATRMLYNAAFLLETQLDYKPRIVQMINKPKTHPEQWFSVAHRIAYIMWDLHPHEGTMQQTEHDQLKPKKSIWALHLSVYKTKSGPYVWPLPIHIDNRAKNTLKKDEWEHYKKFTGCFLLNLELIVPNKWQGKILPPPWNSKDVWQHKTLPLLQNIDPKQVYPRLPTILQISLERQIQFNFCRVNSQIIQQLEKQGIQSDRTKIAIFLKKNYQPLVQQIAIIGWSAAEALKQDDDDLDDIQPAPDPINDHIQPLYDILAVLTQEQRAFHTTFTKKFLKS